MAKSQKLNSMRILEQQGISYEALHYPRKVKDAEAVAGEIGYPADQVFKTLVVESARDKTNYLAVIPANQHLDLKKLAAASGSKKVQLVSHSDAERLTGLQVGGISALALTQKNWPVYLHHTAQQHEYIIMSAGQRGTQLRMPTADFIGFVNAIPADITTGP